MGTWQTCLDRLEGELTAQQFNTWIRPLQAIEDQETLRILAPNQFVLDWVNNRFLDRINGILGDQSGTVAQRVSLEIAEVSATPAQNTKSVDLRALQTPKPSRAQTAPTIAKPRRTSDVSHNPNLNSALTFEKFVEGKSNQLARAAAFQVAGNTGETYNPLFIQGGVGLGLSLIHI